VEGAVARPPEQPALDHEDRLLDLRLCPVAAAVWPAERRCRNAPPCRRSCG
jgi:hypothetical protein